MLNTQSRRKEDEDLEEVEDGKEIHLWLITPLGLCSRKKAKLATLPWKFISHLVRG